MPEITVEKTNNFYDVMIILFAATIAMTALYQTAGQLIDLTNLAKGEQNTSRGEVFEGNLYTAFSVKDIKTIIRDRGAAENTDGCSNKVHRILWLGNSQLHYINQYRAGDHLSPYWLRSGWDNPACIEPLGFSLPNACFQEFLILSRYTQIKLPLNLMIVELVFDDLREDGLRQDFVDLLTPDITEAIRKNSSSAESVVSRFLTTQKSSDIDSPQSVLSGTIQEPVERWLNHKLGSVWHLWAIRNQIEGNVLVGLYFLRNAVFGIKPTSVRKMIRTRYDLNMAALTDMLADCERSGTPALLYIAPIRQDKPMPYNALEYARWKSEVDVLARRYGSRLINLETLVPGELWGSYVREDIDFMHFQGPGHRMVAEALLPHVQKLLVEKDR
jgi:hypothetical protein